MSSLSLPMSSSPMPGFTLPNWRGHAGAAGIAVALHVALAAALLGHDYRPQLPVPVVPVITTQLISVPLPAPAEPEVAPPPAIAPPPEPEVASAPAPVPVVPSEAELAFKRERQRQAEVRQQERIAEQQRRRDEARQRQEQEQARQEQDRLEQQRVAQAAAEAQRAAAERRAADDRARAAASQQYLPISKKAPDYPQRALDKGVQGDCTVSYTVDVQGRVRDPQVLDGCHPWFAQPSLQAARSFKYQPKLVDGRAVEVPGVKNTFHYSIEQGVR